MDSSRLVDTFFDLVRIDSPSRFEAHIAAYCEAYLKVLGFSVRYDDSQTVTGSNTGNLIATRKGTVPGHIMLSAHMDCVDPCEGVEPVIKDGIIVAAGQTILGADDKAGIAAIFEGLFTVIKAGTPIPTVTVLLTTCEELSLLGAVGLPDDLFEQDVPCFVFDADGKPGTIVIGAPYHCSLEASFVGKGAHAGVEPEAGRSAIQMAARAIELMDLGRLDEQTTASVGTIEGGREVNIIPDSCAIRGECRFLSEQRGEEVRAQITKACKSGAAQFGGEVSITWSLDYPGILYEENDPLVRYLVDVAEVVGLEPRFSLSGGGADTNIINAKGPRAITLGIGMTGFHSFDEHISIKDLEDAARFCEALITGVANLD